MKETVKGLIIKRTPFKENDMLLTVLTAEKGKMNVLARGLRKSRRDLSGYQTLAYAELEIFDGRGLAVVDDAEVCEAFEGLCRMRKNARILVLFAGTSLRKMRARRRLFTLGRRTHDRKPHSDVFGNENIPSAYRNRGTLTPFGTDGKISGISSRTQV